MKKKLNCILLVDDDEPTNFINKIIIEQLACTERIEIAQTGKEALKYLTSSDFPGHSDGIYPAPDLIFLDINMPSMNGWEFLDLYKRLKKDQRGRIVIVMLTTSLSPNDIQRANEIPDVTGFEHKPLKKENVMAVLQKHFPDYF